MNQNKANSSFKEFIALIAMLMALVAFAINMILPAFQEIADGLGIHNVNDIQLVVSLLYLGLALGQVIYGLLSDTLGRKPSIYSGLILFIFGCLISISAPSLYILIVGQIIQGIGLGAPRVVTFAIIRDKYEGDDMAQAMSFIMAIFILAPTISPALGQGVLLLGNWRVIFAVFLTLAMVMLIWFRFRQPETLFLKQRTPFSFRHIKNNIWRVIKSHVVMGYTIMLGFFLSAFVGYLNLSQQIFQIQYGLGRQYPMYFAILSLFIGWAFFLNGSLVMYFGMKTMTKYALITSSAISVLFGVMVHEYSGHPPLWMLMSFMMIALFCFGILVGNLNALAMEPLGQIAGAGAAIIGSISTLISVPGAILIGNNYSGSVLPLVVGFATFGTLSLVIFYWINN